MRLVAEAPGPRRPRFFIVGAGAAAHLGGVSPRNDGGRSSACRSNRPREGDGRAPRHRADASRRPGGDVSIGKPGATNAGVLAAQILGVGDQAMAKKLVDYKKKLADKVESAAQAATLTLARPGTVRLARDFGWMTVHVKYSSSPSAAASTRRTRSRSRRDLRARGGVETPSRDADLVIVNTCSVTATADQGARRPSAASRARTRRAIVATGCYATRCETKSRRCRRRPRRCATTTSSIWLRAVDADSAASVRRRRRALRRGRSNPASPGGRRSPSARRPAARSVRLLHHPVDARRVAQPADRGARARGRARRGRRLQGSRRSPACTSARTAATCAVASLLELLRALDAIDGDVTFRISSLEPMDCTPEIVALVARSGRFCRTSTCRCSTRAIACSRRCGGPYTLD
jgi:hypothetical protein